jgi:transposase InsO family protein
MSRSAPDSDGLYGRWRRHYNAIRPHSALGYRSPAPDAKAVVVTAYLPQSNAPR